MSQWRGDVGGDWRFFRGCPSVNKDFLTPSEPRTSRCCPSTARSLFLTSTSSLVPSTHAQLLCSAEGGGLGSASSLGGLSLTISLVTITFHTCHRTYRPQTKLPLLARASGAVDLPPSPSRVTFFRRPLCTSFFSTRKSTTIHSSCLRRKLTLHVNRSPSRKPHQRSFTIEVHRFLCCRRTLRPDLFVHPAIRRPVSQV